MKRAAMLVMTAAICFSNVGCVSRGIKEAVGLFRGAKGVVTPIVELGPEGQTPLAPFERFVVEPFEDRTATGVPAEVPQLLPTYVEQELASREILNLPSARTLIIRGTYIYYEDSTEVIDQAFGPFEELLARVQLVDADTGEIVGEAYCVGRTGESVTQGPEKKAEGLAKAIVKWIQSAYPQSEE